MGAGETKNKIVDDEVLVVDDEEVGDKEMMCHLHREIEELRVKNRSSWRQYRGSHCTGNMKV